MKRTQTKSAQQKPLARDLQTDASKVESVSSYLAMLDHPYKAEIVALRQIILGADPAIGEGIKWNVPSFRTTEYFATLHLRGTNGIGVVLHFGAKKQGLATTVSIDDPSLLLTWLAQDRAMATFRDLQDIEAKQAAFQAVIRQWVKAAALLAQAGN